MGEREEIQRRLQQVDAEMVRHYEEMFGIISDAAQMIAERLDTQSVLAEGVVKNIMLEAATDLRELVQPIEKMRGCDKTKCAECGECVGEGDEEDGS
jgi:hypothetical protein